MKHIKKLTLGTPKHWKRSECAVLLFVFGGIGYGLLEVIWRGYTHPTMLITGGVCFTAIVFLNRKLLKLPLLFRSAVCTLLVTAVEFVVGLLVNRILHLNVWDYSDEAFHLLGQICAEYTFFWFLLCTMLSIALSHVFGKNKGDTRLF